MDKTKKITKPKAKVERVEKVESATQERLETKVKMVEPVAVIPESEVVEMITLTQVGYLPMGSVILVQSSKVDEYIKSGKAKRRVK